MHCEEIADRLVESARREVEPGRVPRAHMQTCSACRDRWEAEENLTVHVKAIRLSAWDQRSSAASREMLMQRFARRNRPAATPRWYWALAAAAALVISVFAVPDVERRLGLSGVPAAQPGELARGVPQGVAQYDATTDATPEVPADPQTDAEAEGFIAVPFVPPLATGEMVRVEHTELNPAALASLGVNVDPAWNTQLPADVLVGEDGMPRAVRVSDASASDGGF
jgi:hypothetical protein